MTPLIVSWTLSCQLFICLYEIHYCPLPCQQGWLGEEVSVSLHALQMRGYDEA